MAIVLIIVLILLVLWFISTQRRLVAMDENINNAMSQIGVQLSSRWDALTALLDLTKGYAEHEYKTLSETIKMRSGITAKSTAAESPLFAGFFPCAPPPRYPHRFAVSCPALPSFSFMIPQIFPLQKPFFRGKIDASKCREPEKYPSILWHREALRRLRGRTGQDAGSSPGSSAAEPTVRIVGGDGMTHVTGLQSVRLRAQSWVVPRSICGFVPVAGRSLSFFRPPKCYHYKLEGSL